ncbi:hypothetical protein OP10G_0857 [Fimbriimonas ginsengisoli Gsoil 348]|uniref:Putative restriction endonuclease domain-containing protein n=2 Tax=Fimbriimonas ginsengisoli TaxID=1005039 RepID=A0A068NNA0_FIMGI|nr:hypothetical protein OP10G_0857 [Fimbriimonas ginsengisoli Gsoil 348]
MEPSKRLELVDGQIVEKMTHHPPHVICIEAITRLLILRVGQTHSIRSQAPIALSDISEPEPDLTVVPGRPADYLKGHPTPEQIDMLIEVSDSSLDRDRRYKVPLYAKAGIREVWLVDVDGRRLEAYREPSPEGYRIVTTLAYTERLAPLFAPGILINVIDLLPPAQ